MSSRKAYDKIPDVEEGIINDTPGQQPKLSPKERYPNANSDAEAELLCTMDDAIENAVPTFDPPLLPVKKPDNFIGSLSELVKLIQIPLLTFAALVGGAVLVVMMDSPIAKALYPYFIAVTSFLASVPSLKKKISDVAQGVVGTIENKIEEMKGMIEDVASEGMGYVQKVDTALINMLEPIKPQLDLAAKFVNVLQKFDPSIDIPDPGDMEGIIKDSSSKVSAVFTTLKQSLNFVKFIPKPFQSISLFDMYLMYPVLGLFLVLQLYGVYADQSKTVVEPHTGSNFEDTQREQTALIMGAFKSFLTSVTQIFLAFLASQEFLLNIQINKFIRKSSDDVIGLIRSIVEPVLRKSLLNNIENLKDMVLEFSGKVDKLQQALKKSRIL